MQTTYPFSLPMVIYSKLSRGAIALFLSILLSACAGAGSNDASGDKAVARVILSSIDCGITKESADLDIIGTVDELDRHSQKLAALIRQSLSEKDYMVFSQERVLLISMGLKRTGGYRLSYTGDTTLSEDNWLQLGLQWHTPPKGAMLTQVITSPCLLLVVPKQEFRGVKVLDQTGAVRLQKSM